MFYFISPEKFSNDITFYFKLISTFLFVISVLGIIFNYWDSLIHPENYLCALFFIGLVRLTLEHKRYTNCPLSLIYNYYIIVFFLIPAAFYCVLGDNYIYGIGISNLPYEQQDYNESSVYGLIKLSIFYFLGYSGIFLGNKNVNVFNTNYHIKVSISKVIMLALIVAYMTISDLNEIVEAIKRAYEDKDTAGKPEGLINFILWDAAFLVLFGYLFGLRDIFFLKYQKHRQIIFNLIFILFVLVGLYGGSKASVLIVFVLSILIPSTVAQNKNYMQSYGLNYKYLFFLIPFMLFAFSFAEVQRQTSDIYSQNRIELWFNIIINLGDFFNFEYIFLSIQNILYRLSFGGFDRVLLVFKSFDYFEFDYFYSSNYLIYLYKSLLNLILPGTPYLEAYLPSGQLFNDILKKNELIGTSTHSDFLLQANTQTMSIFGTLYVIFGFSSAFVIFLYFYLFSRLYSRLKYLYFKLIFAFLFLNTLGTFGIEASIASAIHLAVSIFIMILFINIKLLKLR